MGQYWQFFNVDKRQIGIRHGFSKLGEFFFLRQGFLVRSITVPYGRPDFHEHFKAKHIAANESNAFLSLPTEILIQIVEDIDLESAVVLAITCRRLFDVLCDSLPHWRTNSAAPWAHRRIICLGDYAAYEDVPSSLYNAKERAEIEREDESPEDNQYYGGIYRLNPKEIRYGPPLGAFGYHCHNLVDDDDKWSAQDKRFTRADRERFDVAMGLTYPDRKDWALCNWSKREYVLASTIAKLGNHPNDPQPFLPHCGVDLGQALLSRICWSSDPSNAMPSGPVTDNLYRGKWAGDQICITTLERLGSSSMGQWADISEEVALDLINIYRASFTKWKESMATGCVGDEEVLELRWFASDGDDETAKLGRWALRRTERQHNLS